MTESEYYSYRMLSFTEFIDLYKIQYETQHKGKMPKARLFELTLPWLAATEEFMLSAKSKVIVHCLHQIVDGEEPILSIAWPLVHTFDNSAIKKSASSKHHITSLTSFYSSVAEPIFFTSPVKEDLQQLFSYIAQEHQWHSMQLGAFEEGIVAQALVEYFPYQRIFSKTDNVYQTGISDYASYYQQRPSQLRNPF